MPPYVHTDIHTYVPTYVHPAARSWIRSPSQNRCRTYLGPPAPEIIDYPPVVLFGGVRVWLLAPPRVTNVRSRRALIGTSRVPLSLSALALACVLSEVYCLHLLRCWMGFMALLLLFLFHLKPVTRVVRGFSMDVGIFLPNWIPGECVYRPNVWFRACYSGY